MHDDFYEAGESTTDLSMGIICGGILEGAAIFWQKKYEPLISIIRLEDDWAIAIKVAHKRKSTFIILNVYTPYKSYQNEN